MYVTTSEIAAVGICGTLAGTWLGSFLNSRTQKSLARFTLEAQQGIAKEQRLWNERRTIYLDILATVNGFTTLRNAVLDTAKAGKPVIGMLKSRAKEIPDELGNQIKGFASNKISDLYVEAIDTQLSWLTVLRAGATEEPADEAFVRRLEAAHAAAINTERRLIVEVRSQLQALAVHD